jgi:hypothetical protein
VSGAATVTLDDVLMAASARGASLVPETSGYLLLAILDATSCLPVRLDERSILLSTEGSVSLTRRGDVVSPTEAARSMRHMLGRLLSMSIGRMPGLASAARLRADDPNGLEAVLTDVEAALIPVNRAAAQRALARLAREALRVQGTLTRKRPARTLKTPPPEAPARKVEAKTEAPSAAIVSQKITETFVASATEPEIEVSFELEEVEPKVTWEETPAPVIEIALDAPIEAGTDPSGALIEAPPEAPALAAVEAIATSEVLESIPVNEEPEPTVLDAVLFAPIETEENATEIGVEAMPVSEHIAQVEEPAAPVIEASAINLEVPAVESASCEEAAAIVEDPSLTPSAALPASRSIQPAAPELPIDLGSALPSEAAAPEAPREPVWEPAVIITQPEPSAPVLVVNPAQTLIATSPKDDEPARMIDLVRAARAKVNESSKRSSNRVDELLARFGQATATDNSLLQARASLKAFAEIDPTPPPPSNVAFVLDRPTKPVAEPAWDRTSIAPEATPEPPVAEATAAEAGPSRKSSGSRALPIFVLFVVAIAVALALSGKSASLFALMTRAIH